MFRGIRLGSGVFIDRLYHHQTTYLEGVSGERGVSEWMDEIASLEGGLNRGAELGFRRWFYCGSGTGGCHAHRDVFSQFPNCFSPGRYLVLGAQRSPSASLSVLFNPSFWRLNCSTHALKITVVRRSSRSPPQLTTTGVSGSVTRETCSIRKCRQPSSMRYSTAAAASQPS